MCEIRTSFQSLFKALNDRLKWRDREREKTKRIVCLVCNVHRHTRCVSFDTEIIALLIDVTTHIMCIGVRRAIQKIWDDTNIRMLIFCSFNLPLYIHSHLTDPTSTSISSFDFSLFLSVFLCRARARSLIFRGAFNVYQLKRVWFKQRKKNTSHSGQHSTTRGFIFIIITIIHVFVVFFLLCARSSHFDITLSIDLWFFFVCAIWIRIHLRTQILTQHYPDDSQCKQYEFDIWLLLLLLRLLLLFLLHSFVNTWHMPTRRQQRRPNEFAKTSYFIESKKNKLSWWCQRLKCVHFE